MNDKDKELEQLLNDPLFLSWIEGNAGPQENERWAKWMQSNLRNEELVTDLRKVIQGLNFKRTKNLNVNGELKKLNHSIDAYSRVRKLHILHTKAFGFERLLPKVAAAILMLIVAVVVLKVAQRGYFETINEELVVQEHTISSTESGQKKILTLADGSRITLNANSQLKYPSSSTGGDVEVWLEGEAFFQVNHRKAGNERTFKVHVDQGEISVLGTTFNINTYGDQSEVYLSEGSVQVQLIDRNNEVKDTRLMEPGEVSVLSPILSRIKTSRAASEFHTAWTNNKLVFDRTSLEDISTRLGHIYDVEFNFEEEQYKSLLISGSLPNNNLTVFIKALEEIVNQEVTLNDNVVTIGK